MSATSHEVTEPSLHHTGLHCEVDHRLLLTVVNTCENSLVRLLLHDLYLLDKLCRNVLRCKLRVVKEECLAVDGDLCDGLTIRCDGTVSLNLYAWELLEELLEHVVVRSLE